MRYLLLLLLALTANRLYSKDNVRLRGTISNPLTDSISVNYAFRSIVYKPETTATRIDKHGKFEMTLEVPPGLTRLDIVHGGESTEVMVEPGADLALIVDGRHFDSSLHYEGKGKEIANFMAKHVLERHAMLEFAVAAQKLCSKEPADYELSLKALETEEDNFLAANGGALPASFTDYYKTYYHFKVYANMDMYPRIHEMIKQKTNRVTRIPQEDYVVADDVPWEFNDRFLDNEGYREYIFNVVSVKIAAGTAGTTPAPPDPNAPDTMLTVIYDRMPPLTAEFLAGYRIYLSTKYKTSEALDKEFERYRAHFPESANLAILRHALDIKKTIAVGKEAPDFDITTPDGKKMKLSDLRGNAVYIDFWSRGCVPCIAEMPEAKKIHEHFRDQPVRFVNVSLDADATAWLKAIKAFDVDGINTHVDKDWQSELVQKYGVKGIPSYFLIDKNGKFSAIENVARPSDAAKLTTQIESLIK